MLAPAHRPRAQRRRELRAHVVQQRRRRRGDSARGAPIVGAQRRVVGPVEHDRVDEPADHARGASDRAARSPTQNVTRTPTSRGSRSGEHRASESAPIAATPRSAAPTSATQRQRALQEQVGERERKVLIQDREGERQRRVMAEQLDRPRRVALVQLAQVQRRDREDRQRRGPQRAARAGLAARDGRQRHHERDERVGQQPHAERRRQRAAGPRRARREAAAAIALTAYAATATIRFGQPRHARRRARRAAPSARRPPAGSRAREKPTAVRNGNGPAMPTFGSSYAGSAQRFQTRPRTAVAEQQRIEARRAPAARLARTHHRQQHRVEHDAGAQADQIQQLAHDRSSDALTLRRDRRRPEPEPHERSVSTDEWSIARSNSRSIVGPVGLRRRRPIRRSQADHSSGRHGDVRRPKPSRPCGFGRRRRNALVACRAVRDGVSRKRGLMLTRRFRHVLSIAFRIAVAVVRDRRGRRAARRDWAAPARCKAR